MGYIWEGLFSERYLRLRFGPELFSAGLFLSFFFRGGGGRLLSEFYGIKCNCSSLLNYTCRRHSRETLVLILQLFDNLRRGTREICGKRSERGEGAAFAVYLQKYRN